MEKATVMMTTTGSMTELTSDDNVSLSLTSLWKKLDIQDLEAIE